VEVDMVVQVVKVVEEITTGKVEHQIGAAADQVDTKHQAVLAEKVL
jgi:hypothetical protein